MEMDFLEMFDDCSGIDETGTGNPVVSERCLDDVLDEVCPDSTDKLPSINASQSQLVKVQSEDLEEKKCRHRHRGMSISWKRNAKAKSWYLHFCKSQKQRRTDETTILHALVQLQKRTKTGKRSAQINVKRLKRSRLSRGKGGSEYSMSSLVLQSKMKPTGGNRFQNQFSIVDFLEVAFGEKDSKDHFHLIGNIAKHFKLDRKTASIMRTTVAASVFSKQIHLGARLWQICNSRPPTTVAVRHAWDETAQDISVKLIGKERTRSAWKVMVQKLSVTIFWMDSSLTFDFVLGLEFLVLLKQFATSYS